MDSSNGRLPQIASAVAERRARDERRLTRLARRGRFVHEHSGGLGFSPTANAAFAAAISIADSFASKATIELFGRFDFCIDGRPVRWQRRRDRQIVQYLAMQPDGRATRSQLIATFWPDADRQLAAQSLRTACSTIRRALAAYIGAANVGRYFVAGAFVELKLERIDSSLDRFNAHIADGDRAFERADIRAAYLHYSAALHVYRSPLLAGEAPAAWIEPHAATLSAAHRRMMERLCVLDRCVSSDDAAGLRSVLERTARSA